MGTTLTTRGAAALAAGLLGLIATTGTANAQSSRHIDRLARELERQAQTLHDEVHAHFRTTPQFRHLDRDVAEMEQLAGHIHEVLHEGAGVPHLRRDVDRLDRLFHHVEDLVDQLAFFRGADRRAVAHLREALDDMGDTLHHLKDDLRELEGRMSRPVFPPPAFPGRP
jgi:hypothetical protein